MIDALGSIVSKVSGVFEINSSTLSGSIDILVVNQGNNCFKSTPFHVRFGKFKLFQSNLKNVIIEVNGVKSPFKMTLDAAGEAYFEILVPAERTKKSRSQNLLGKDIDESFVSDADEYRSETTNSPELKENPRESKEDEEKNDILKIEQALERELPEEVKKETKQDSKKSDHSQEKNEPMSMNISQGHNLKNKTLGWLWDKLPEKKKKLVITKAQESELSKSTTIVRDTTLEGSEMSKSTTLQAKKSSITQESGEITLIWGPKDRLPVSELTLSKIMGSLVSDQDEPTSSDEDADDMPSNELKATIPLENEPKKMKLKKTFRPTSEMLKSLNLKLGANTIKFSVSSKLRGTQSLVGNIFLLAPDTKIVLSDIDGTITRSDLLGHLVPMVGGDWSHMGVSELFNSIYSRGYFVLYLSARPIGQAGQTRNFIKNLSQQAFVLPPGPVIMSPDRFFHSFKREVIDRKPEIFKIACLKGIKRLFPVGYQPFYAGFGNRETDAISYRAVGMEMHRIFVINSKSQIQQLTNPNKLSYGAICKIVHDIFPPLNDNESKKSTQENFDFNENI